MSNCSLAEGGCDDKNLAENSASEGMSENV